MTEANYRRTVRARHRSDTVARITAKIAAGALAELSHHHVVYPPKSPQEAKWL